jgi:hypothetical protein
MKKTRALCLLAGTALAAAMTIGAATPAEAACRAPVRGAQVSGVNQTLTEFRARSSWRTRVRAIYGYRFSRWSYARNKNMDCNKDRPGRTWYCRATATPCDRPPRSP